MTNPKDMAQHGSAKDGDAAPESEGHTPTPWHTGGIFNPGTPDEHVTIWSEPPAGCQSGDEVAQYLTQQDAAFIVRACNSHDALVAALTRVQALSKPGQQLDIHGAIDVICEIWNVASAALSQATDETGRE